MEKKGLFITFEGSEGAGKTTLLNNLAAGLRSRGCSVLCLREPGGTTLGEEIRSVLKNPDRSEEICPMAELLLMYAARAQLVQQQILPALKRGSIVLCDRHDLSSYAYQGGGRGLDRELILRIRQAVLGSFVPDLTLLIEVPAQLGLQRARRRGGTDRFEQEEISFFERVCAAYHEAAAALPYAVIIDGTQSEQEVLAQAQAQVDRLLVERGYAVC